MNMINKFFKLFKIYEYLVLLLLVLVLPCLIEINHRINFVYILLTNNYITLIINVCFFLIMYKKVQIFNTLKYQVITRMTRKKFTLIIHFFATFTTLIFIILLYSFLLIMYGSREMSFILFVLLMINTIFFLVLTNVIFLQFNRKQNILFVLIPILLNFAYHYIFYVH